jgi:hypothetical protein
VRNIPIPGDGNTAQLISLKDGIVKFIDDPSNQGEKHDPVLAQVTLNIDLIPLLIKNL